MIQLSDVEVVLPDRILSGGTVVIEGDRIMDVTSGTRSTPAPFRLRGHYVVPGFIDVHVHGVDGSDSLDGGDVIHRLAKQLPRFGVTAFCPTSIACAPTVLRELLQGIREARANP